MGQKTQLGALLPFFNNYEWFVDEMLSIVKKKWLSSCSWQVEGYVGLLTNGAVAVNAANNATPDKLNIAKGTTDTMVEFMQGAFFNCSSQFSVPKWKTMGSQSEILFHEILDVQKILVGWTTFLFLALIVTMKASL